MEARSTGICWSVVSYGVLTTVILVVEAIVAVSFGGLIDGYWVKRDFTAGMAYATNFTFGSGPIHIFVGVVLMILIFAGAYRAGKVARTTRVGHGIWTILGSLALLYWLAIRLEVVL